MIMMKLSIKKCFIFNNLNECTNDEAENEEKHWKEKHDDEP